MKETPLMSAVQLQHAHENAPFQDIGIPFQEEVAKIQEVMKEKVLLSV